MWKFIIWLYDPDTDTNRKFVSQVFYPTFLEATLAADMAVSLMAVAVPESEEHWIIQDVDILEETFLETQEETQTKETEDE